MNHDKMKNRRKKRFTKWLQVNQNNSDFVNKSRKL